MNPLAALGSLKDIEGVYGSFVVDRDGTPLFRDLPVVIASSALCEAGPRIARLWGALPQDDSPLQAMITFSSHLLFVRRFTTGSLCVFVPLNVNKPALGMAVDIVSRFFDEHLEGLVRDGAGNAAEPSSPPPAPPAAASSGQAVLPPGAPPVPQPQPQSQPASPGAEPARKKRTFIYRGQRYES